MARSRRQRCRSAFQLLSGTLLLIPCIESASFWLSSVLNLLSPTRRQWQSLTVFLFLAKWFRRLLFQRYRPYGRPRLCPLGPRYSSESCENHRNHWDNVQGTLPSLPQHPFHSGSDFMTGQGPNSFPGISLGNADRNGYYSNSSTN